MATLLSFPPVPGSGLGAYIVGLTDALGRIRGLEHSMIAPDRIRGSAGQWTEQLSLAFQHFLRLRRERPDVVHAHDQPVLLGAAIAYRVVSRRSARVVYSSHIDPAERLALWKRLILGWLLARCWAVTVVSRDSAKKLGFLAWPVPRAELVRIVPGAASVHVRRKNDAAVAAFSKSIAHEGGPVLLQVSNFYYAAKVEGTMRLVEAIAKVRTRFPAVRLILLGTGPRLDSVRATAERLGVASAVTIPGEFLEDLSLPLTLADVHCHISFQDACPISVLEAMHASKPVVASRTGGIPEMIEHGVTGLLVGGDPNLIADAIIDLLEHPEEALAMGVRAQRVASTKYTWDRVAQDFEELYQDAPRPSPRSSSAKVVNVAD